MTPCRLVHRYQNFGITCSLNLMGRRVRREMKKCCMIRGTNQWESVVRFRRWAHLSALKREGKQIRQKLWHSFAKLRVVTCQKRVIFTLPAVRQLCFRYRTHVGVPTTCFPQCVPQSLQTNAEVVPEVRPRLFPCTYFPIHYHQIIWVCI